MKITVKPPSLVNTVLETQANRVFVDVIVKKPPRTSTVLGIPGPDGHTGPSGVTRISAADDVDSTTLADGSVLVYQTSTNKWTSGTLLNQQTIDAGEF